MERAIRKNRQDVADELLAELECPPFPMALSYVWQAWVRLRRRTPAGFNGPNPITIEAIDAFIRRTGLRLNPYDVDLIERVDDLYLSKMAEQQASERDRQQALRDGLGRASKQGIKTAKG